MVDSSVPGGKRFISPLIRRKVAPLLREKFIPWLKSLVDEELDTIIEKDPTGRGLKRRIGRKLDALLSVNKKKRSSRCLLNYKYIKTATMPLLKLTGTESVLTLHLEHPIHLDPNAEYYMALVGFYSENNIYNLLQHAKVYFWDLEIHLIPKPLILQCGYWTIEKLKKSFRDYIQSLNLSVNSNDFKIFKDGDKISINSPIKFYLDKTVSDLLGFEKSDATNLQKESTYFNSNENVIASNPPNLRAVDVIEIHCNIVNNSLVNHDVHSHKHLETAILYSFSPNVPHGYKISQSPQEKHCIPLRSGLRKIQQITITLVDQNNQLLQNNHVNNIVYLDLISKSQTHTYSKLW
ncbi:hypothetical protein J6590_064896 [Homalodisca vitripennis]|nr:hypothetical protein J6590_064896 [Homalodisca vitripennis]